MKRARILPITQLGRPVLRERARAVRDLSHPALHQLIRDMTATVKKVKGVGIAAPQVGVPARLFIVAPFPNPRYPQAPRMKPLAMINPRLLSHSSQTHVGWEGCLSIPGIRGPVARYRTVEVEFTTARGRRVRRRLRGFVAVIFQHEFDHINGRVFLDRIRDTRTLMTESEYRSQQPYARA